MPAPAATPRQTLWISADLWGQTVIVLMEGTVRVKAATFASASPDGPLQLPDVLERITAYAASSRAPDGTLAVFLGEGPSGVEPLRKELLALADCTVVGLGPDAPLFATLVDVVKQADGAAEVLDGAPEEQERAWTPPDPNAIQPEEGEEEAPVIPGYQPLAGRVVPHAPGDPMTVGVEPLRDRRQAHSVIGETRAPGSVVRMAGAGGEGGGGSGQGQGAATVIRGESDGRPTITGRAPRQPRMLTEGGGPAPAGTAPAPRTPAARSPWATQEAVALEAAAREVAKSYPEEVVAATGFATLVETPPGALLLWAMTHGRVEEVLGASPDLAAEHLRALSTTHREAIITELGVATWGEVSVEEIALWLAERKGTGELPEASVRGLERYRAALRARR